MQQQQQQHRWLVYNPTENEQKYLGKKLKSL